jgi:16S rRNA A1518/A1519 N6-dimethyltransferase RsmA/KsgA/DIM1 with predicted DNA glycosylase/AP lyase activity
MARIEKSIVKNAQGEFVEHLVLDDNKIWMSNDDAEIYDIERAISQAFGKCLVAGLGMGLMACQLLKKKSVCSVDVVEIDEKIIGLCGPKVYRTAVANGKDLRFIVGDALKTDFLDDTIYDYCFFDIYLEPTEEAFKDFGVFKTVLANNTHKHTKFEAWELPKLERGDFWKS